MLDNFLKSLDDLRKGRKVSPDRRNDDIVLKIVANNLTIAYLSSENNGSIFTLVYTSDFYKSGVPAFNMKPGGKPELGKAYKSDVLWYPFTARIPSSSRPDFNEEMEKANLTGTEPVLEIIGKLSKTSISRSWTIHIDQAA